MLPGNDWYSQATRNSNRTPDRYRRSQAWHYSAGAETATERAYRLLGTLRSFARNQGVPYNTVIRLAAQTEVGTACAGFLDAPRSCTKPFILIDKPLLDRMADADQMDAMVGLVLHEAAHILYTREFYRRPKLDRSNKIWYFENLLEDYRIEELLAQSSPGYVPYIEATKQVLLVDEWFRTAVEDWDELADTRRIMALIGSFVRAPHIFEEHPHLKTWTDLLGRNIFEELRQRLPGPPRTEADVRRLAVDLNDLISDYFNRALQALVEKNNGDISPDEAERLKRQRDADFEEVLYEKLRPTREEQQNGALRTIGALLDASDRQNQIGEGFDEETLQGVARIENEDDSITHVPAPLPEADAIRILPSQIRELVKLVTVSPSSYGATMYNNARSRVANQIARLTSGFPSSIDVSTARTSSVTGRLDARRLWRAPFDERIFSNLRTNISQSPVHVALLLDASGSMQLGGRWARALETAVLFCEALKHHPFATLQLYSHTSVEIAGKQKCLVSLFPGQPGDIGTYCHDQANYDDIAIQVVTTLENKKQSSNCKRILIVVSDGMPCDIRTGQQTSGGPTAQAVAACRKQGWKVLGVGIGTSHVLGIYGERWSLCVPDGNTLPDRMAMMLVRLLKQLWSAKA